MPRAWTVGGDDQPGQSETAGERPAQEGGEKERTRVVPLLDPQLCNKLERYLVTHCPNKRYPIFGSKKNRSKPITAQTARNWLAETVERAARDGITLPDMTVHTFRHSYAVNLLIHGVKRDQLQLWMGGHSDPESTLVYTRLLSIDSGFAQPEISFSVPPADNPLLATPTRHRLSE